MPLVSPLGETPAEQERLLKEGDIDVLRDLATRDVSFSREIFDALVALDDEAVDMHLANRHDLPADLQDLLWERNRFFSRMVLSLNGNTHPALHMKILASGDTQLMYAAAKSAVHKETLLHLSRPENSYLWVAAKDGNAVFDLDLGARFLQRLFPQELEAVRMRAGVPPDEWKPLLEGWDGSGADLVAACELVRQ